ncbi:fatty acyl-CoA reductase 1-like [Anneissia japonica]|uniref:fatty acyl-CoA reductase 1-like n=1 Tax=Anneissia japonica TaxID=1529436 RepID=UPI0014258079|nr:fatty acyl-CoA reductase 1-like [Anneissia japonica]
MTPIEEFYNGQTLLVTGATGFIGKVLLEKILRCCPGIKDVFLLVRPKWGHPTQERVDQLMNCKLFDKLRQTQPNFAEKVHAINSDLQQPQLGMSDEDIATLQEKVTIVFHVAATIKFDEKLGLSLKLNVVATQEMLKLCKKMNSLQVFVHVSTAYAYCDRDHIEEVVYPPPVDPYKLLGAIEWMSEEMVLAITPEMIGKRPNTYTFTKALAEHVLLKESENLPVCIVRPSIVGAAWKEPFQGWIDNFNGPSGLFIATGKGLLRSMKGDTEAIVDISPVDYVVNMMVAAAWHTAIKNDSFFSSEDIPIYYLKTPLEKSFRRPRACFTQSHMACEYWNTVGTKIPSMMIDFYLWMTGQKPRMMKIYDKIQKAVKMLEFFTTNNWQWTNTNSQHLQSSMTEEDRKIFFLDVRPLHWPTYLENYCIGTKQFVLNENLSDLPAARRHIKMLRNIRWTCNMIIAVILWRVLIARSQLARNLWYLVTNLVFKFLRYCRLSSAKQS